VGGKRRAKDWLRVSCGGKDGLVKRLMWVRCVDKWVGRVRMEARLKADIEELEASKGI